MGRKRLRKLNGQRTRFRGTFVRLGHKNGWNGPERTVLLENVTCVESGSVVTDHLWFNLTKGFEKLSLSKGDTVTLDARVTEYVKGYQGRDPIRQAECPISVDYRLSHPTKLAKENEP